jgi:hypothetical protein
MPDVNLWAVLAAALSSFLLGGLWYSPALFGAVWCREAGKAPQQGHSALVFAVSFVLALVAAFAFAVFLEPRPPLRVALGSGAVAGVAWVATSLGINYLFAERSLKLWLIDGGYYSLQFLLFGLVLGLWP